MRRSPLTLSPKRQTHVSHAWTWQSPSPRRWPKCITKRARRRWGSRLLVNDGAKSTPNPRQVAQAQAGRSCALFSTTLRVRWALGVQEDPLLANFFLPTQPLEASGLGLAHQVRGTCHSVSSVGGLLRGPRYCAFAGQSCASASWSHAPWCRAASSCPTSVLCATQHIVKSVLAYWHDSLLDVLGEEFCASILVCWWGSTGWLRIPLVTLWPLWLGHTCHARFAGEPASRWAVEQTPHADTSSGLRAAD